MNSRFPLWNKDHIEIGILGLGVVGSGTVALLESNRGDIERKIGLPLVIKKIAVRDIGKPRAVPGVPRPADHERV